MKTVQQHYNDVMSLGAPTELVTVPIDQARGKILGEDVTARYAIPPFTNSSMDGFAVRASDVQVGQALSVIDDIPAGAVPHRELLAGTAIRIMTGAPMPAGADTVVKVEDTAGQMANMGAEVPAAITVTAPVDERANVRYMGEDVAVGDQVFTRQTRLTPAHIGALSALGYGHVRVHRGVRVGILATGSELRAPGQPLEHGSIPDSNSFLVSGLCQEYGANVMTMSLHSDEPTAFDEAFTALVEQCDLVITTGGVSAGAFDVVKARLHSAGVEFAHVAMQPGKPQGWGRSGSTPVICLPGNPVSVFVSMHLFVLPLLRSISGEIPLSFDEMFTWGVAGTSWRHKYGRDQFMPAILGPTGVVPASAGGSGSHLVGSLPRAEFLALTPATTEWIHAGDTIRILPFR